ncbi:probable chitinase 10 [Procambarus clarkii]|uniref:probable chitinase 10 n=1 Tax=Procambarus clarkii TaxID=6728 RepID=UPI0037444E3E
MKLLLASLAAVVLAASAASDGVMVCYYGSWAVYRPDNGKFDVENIDPAICTHLIFGFAGLGSNNQIKVLDPYNELCENYGKCAYDRFTALKNKNADLITILAVGGWNEGSTKYSNMAADANKRKTFVDSSIEMLKTHNFDGLDMDWEYPTQRGGKPEDKVNFISLLSDLYNELHANGMILTAAVSAGKLTIDPAYDIPAMAQNLDLINLMAYDLHGAWDTYTHHQSGLYQYPDDTGDNVYLNQDFAVRYWIDGGMPSTKIALGVPLYGRCWKLDYSTEENGYYAPASQPGPAGPFTRSPGFLGYNEICEFQKNEGDWVIEIAPGMNEPYTYSYNHERIWCSYDDHDSCVVKASYAKSMNLAGMMVWSLETDDFRAICNDRSFDLIKTLRETFTGEVIPTPPTPPTTTADPDAPTTPSTTTRGPPPPDGVCEQPGLNTDPDNCHHYYLCAPNTENGYDATEEVCPEGTLFNPNAKICDWANSVCAISGACLNDCPSPVTMRLLLLSAATALLALSASAASDGVMVCYYGSWAVYRPDNGKFDVEDIDPAICTHLIFGFAGLGSDNKIRVLDPYNELCENYGKCAYDRFNALKNENADLITILAVGGWNEGSTKYSNMAASAASRQTFVDSSIEMLKTHNFDGLDMDWEYPTQRGGKPEDKVNFISLLSDLYNGLHANGMILTAAVSAGKLTIDPAYDIPAMAENLDLINLMAYDLHGAWDTYTHHQSGLYQYPDDTGDNVYLNQDFAVRYWIDGGMPSTKIALGVPLYGRCWKLDYSTDENGYYAPASQPGPAGPYTRSPGFLGYNEICEFQKNEGDWVIEIAPGMNEPYTYSYNHERIWCSYDDHDSCVVKASYAKSMNLAGMMVWSLETDDFRAICNDRSFDLIKTLRETFTGEVIPTPPTPPTTTADPDAPTTTSTTTRGPPPPDGVCEQPGLNTDPENCHHYYLCAPNTENGYDATEEVCPEGTLFNPNAKICDWANSVCAISGACLNDCP